MKKGIHSVVIISLVMTCGCWSRAASAGSESQLLDNKLRSLIRAASSMQVDDVVTTHEFIRNARLRCEIQLAGIRIPDACFETLKLESRAGLAKPLAEHSGWLESLCRTRAQKCSDIAELRKLQYKVDLPSPCRDVVKERLLDLEYAVEAIKPSVLFNDRFSNRNQ